MVVPAHTPKASSRKPSSPPAAGSANIRTSPRMLTVPMEIIRSLSSASISGATATIALVPQMADHNDAVFGGQAVHAGQETVERVAHCVGITDPNLVDILQDHQRRHLRYCGLEHVTELIRAVFRRPEIDSEGPNRRMAGHDAGDGRFSIAGRPI